jgi:hypothetical protein
MNYVIGFIVGVASVGVFIGIMFLLVRYCPAPPKVDPLFVFGLFTGLLVTLTVLWVIFSPDAINLTR